MIWNKMRGGKIPFFISAKTGEGIEALQEAIADELFTGQSMVKVLLPYSEGNSFQFFMNAEM